MWEIYWITILDNICVFLYTFTILTLLVGLPFFIWGIFEKRYSEESKCIVYKIGKSLIISGIILCIINVFLPNTKQALIIYGVGSTIEYVKSNETAKQLPDKAIMALDKWLESVSESDTTKTK